MSLNPKNIKKITLGNVSSPLSNLNDNDLRYLSEAQNSDLFKVLAKAIDANDLRYSRKEMINVMNDKIQSMTRLGYTPETATLLAYQDLKSRSIEANLILSIPQLAHKELAKRIKDNEQEKKV